VERQLGSAMWRYRARVTVHAPADRIAARLPPAVVVEAVDERTCAVNVGSDTPQLLASYLLMLDADFTVDPAQAPELAAQLDRLSRRCGDATRRPDPGRAAGTSP
jgi:hypothetical protein